MDPLVLLLRLLHIGCGAIWVGMVTFATTFLVPTMRDVGPAGGPVMAALQRRGLMTVMPILAILTLASGFVLYWRAMGAGHAWAASPVGMTFGMGGITSLAAFIIGITVLRPSMLRAGALMQSMDGVAEAARPAVMDEVARLRTRGARSGMLVMLLLWFSLGTMAVARYL